MNEEPCNHFCGVAPKSDRLLLVLEFLFPFSLCVEVKVDLFPMLVFLQLAVFNSFRLKIQALNDKIFLGCYKNLFLY